MMKTNKKKRCGDGILKKDANKVYMEVNVNVLSLIPTSSGVAKLGHTGVHALATRGSLFLRPGAGVPENYCHQMHCCQSQIGQVLPKISTPRMLTLKMSTPKMSTPKNVNSQNVNS